MYYRNNLGFDYPDRCDAHMLTVKHHRDVVLDTDYPYLQKSFWFKCQRAFYWLMQNLIIFWLLRLSHGLRIYGKKNLKAHKKTLKNGAITISNHVFMWDYLCVLKAIRPHLAYFPAWKTNMEGGFAGMIRMSGGIPIPEGNIHAIMAFNKAIEEVLTSGKWLHFYPEGSLWFYYPDIRPFKKAVFQYAVKFDKPVIPISMSFRPRRGLLRLFGKTPTVDLHIGEPLYPDKTLPRNEATEKMRAEAYHVMQVMNGITPDSPTYNTDQDPRHYRKTM